MAWDKKTGSKISGMFFYGAVISCHVVSYIIPTTVKVKKQVNISLLLKIDCHAAVT